MLKFLKNTLDYIIRFQEVHPIRFFSLFIIIFIASMVFMVFLLNTSNRNKVSKVNAFKCVFNILKNKTTLLLTSIMLFIMLTSIVFSNYNRENTSITNSDFVFGLDISHYQGVINWEKFKKTAHPIKYVFVRSTMGEDGIDVHFDDNWKNVKKIGHIRGAYHYYRPNENSTKQFNNFAAIVSLDSGDFPPILDIEVIVKYGIKNLRAGILNWLKLAEAHYGVKPIVYTGRTFYNDYLKGSINGYPLWIASYSSKHKLSSIDWKFHQFSDRIRVKGINHHVDGNDFNGNIEDLISMCLD